MTTIQDTQAISFTSFDPRSMAMGGAGVASAKPYNAALFNPALLINTKTKVSRVYLRPYLGARIIDRDNFIGTVETFQNHNYTQQLNTAISKYRERVDSNITTETDVQDALEHAQNIITTAQNLLIDYQNLSNKPLRVAASAGITLGYEGLKHALSIYYRQYKIGGTIINISNHDLDQIKHNLNVIAQIMDEVTSSLNDANSTTDISSLANHLRSAVFVEDDYTSNLQFQGASVTETGISYAHRFINNPDLLFGITAKRIQFNTIDYIYNIQTAETFDFDNPQHSFEKSHTNIDIGLLQMLGNNFQMGLSLRNLRSNNYITILNNVIYSEPMLRLGFAWELANLTLTSDLDITRNDPLGFDPDKRYLSLGAEWRIRHNTALRAGYRHNTVSRSSLWSFGIGLGPRQSHLDLSFAIQGDELGLALQFAGYF